MDILVYFQNNPWMTLAMFMIGGATLRTVAYCCVLMLHGHPTNKYKDTNDDLFDG